MALMSPTRPEDQLQMTMGTQPAQLGMVQHPMHAMIAPLEPAPPEIDPAVAMGMSPDQPDTSKFEQPKVKQMSATDQYKEKLAQKQMSDLQKDANPYGSENNHPGFFGKLLHGLSVATGGPNRRAMAEEQRNNDILGIEKKESEQALQNAQTGNFRSETETRDMERPFIAPKAEAEIGLQDAETDEKRDTLNNGPDLAHAYAHAVNQALKQGRDPSQDPIVNHLADAITSIQKQPQPKSVIQSQPTIGPDGKPHTYILDATTGLPIRDAGVHYERPITVNTGTNEKAWEYSNNQLNTIGKPISDLAMRMGRLKDTLAQGNPQADALIGPELLTVMAGGQGSGLRMNEAEIARVIGGRSAWENLKASMQHWSVDPTAARSITPEQDQQIRKLIQHVDGKMQKKLGILNDAASRLVDVSDMAQQHKLVADTRQALQQVDLEGDQSAPIVQHSPSTGQYRYSTDGGKTWQAGQPPNR